MTKKEFETRLSKIVKEYEEGYYDEEIAHMKMGSVFCETLKNLDMKGECIFLKISLNGINNNM